MEDKTPLLELVSVSVSYGNGASRERILHDVALKCRAHEILAIIGKSGCGKTSLLKCIAGLIRPDSGQVLLSGRAISGPGRERGLVFQAYSVFPWLTVRGNIELGARCGIDSRPGA